MQLILENPPKTARRSKRKARKLTPAQRKVALANLAKARRARGTPARSTSRRRRLSSRTSTQSNTTMPATRRRRSTSRRSPARRSTSRRRGGGGRGGALPANLTTIAATAGGFIAAGIIPSYIPVPQLQTGFGRIGAKAGLGILTFMLLKRTNKNLATALASGMLTSAAVDVVARFMPAAAVAAGSSPGGSRALAGIGAPDGIDYSANDLAGTDDENVIDFPAFANG